MAKKMKPGTLHPRTCVRTIWPWATGQKPSWIPIIGPSHEDREFIRFPMEHWHVDYRFLPERQRREHNNVFAIPVTHVWPDVPDADGSGIPLAELAAGKFPLESYLRTMRRRFGVPYPGYPGPHRAFWLPELQAAYGDEHLGPDLVCPHRGLPLEGMLPDAEGCVTCPGHGLRWHLESGALRPQEDDS